MNSNSVRGMSRKWRPGPAPGNPPGRYARSFAAAPPTTVPLKNSGLT